MKHLQRLYMLFAAIVALISATIACSESAMPDTYNGIGTVEINDTAFVIHYYEYDFIVTNAPVETTLEDGNRVSFKCQTIETINETEQIYLTEAVELSGDITQEIVFKGKNETLQSYTDNIFCIPLDMHVTRDWHRNDFFNITTYYPTAENYNDSIRIVYDITEQTAQREDTITLWLRHYQSPSGEANQVEYNTISVPINILKNENYDRVCLRVKRLGMENDTVTNSYIYSY